MTVNTARGSVLWILLGILALDTARKYPTLWIKPVVRDVDTATRGSGSGYSKRFSTLDTAIGSVIKTQPGVLILDTAIGSGSGYNKGSSVVDTARGSVLRIQQGLQYSGYNQEFWLWIQPWTRDSSTWDLSRDIEKGSWIWTQSWTQIHLGLGIYLVIQIVHSRGLGLTKVLDLPAP